MATPQLERISAFTMEELFLDFAEHERPQEIILDKRKPCLADHLVVQSWVVREFQIKLESAFMRSGWVASQAEMCAQEFITNELEDMNDERSCVFRVEDGYQAIEGYEWIKFSMAVLRKHKPRLPTDAIRDFLPAHFARRWMYAPSWWRH